MRAAMPSLPRENTAQKVRDSATTRAKAAAMWLCFVAVATVLNSLILFKYARFIDLFIGLSFTQFIDAIFVGMQLEPPGAPWWYTTLPALMLDMPFVLVLLLLAVKVAQRRRRATQVSLWLYATDTLVITLSFAASIAMFHSPIRPIAWQSLTLVVHGVGLLILSRAWRSSVSAQITA